MGYLLSISIFLHKLVLQPRDSIVISVIMWDKYNLVQIHFDYDYFKAILFGLMLKHFSIVQFKTWQIYSLLFIYF